jgi:hypothetical protein
MVENLSHQQESAFALPRRRNNDVDNQHISTGPNQASFEYLPSCPALIVIDTRDLCLGVVILASLFCPIDYKYRCVLELTSTGAPPLRHHRSNCHIRKLLREGCQTAFEIL